MSICRETPLILTNWSDSCLYQILNNSVLSQCQTESYPDLIFYERIGPQWAISLPTPTTCQLIKFSTSTPPIILQNTPRAIPAVSILTILTIPPHTSLTYPDFTIQPLPALSGPPMTIWDPTIPNNLLPDTFHLGEQLADRARWSQIPYISDELRLAYNFIASKTLHPQLPPLRDVHGHPLELLSTSILAILLLLISVLVYCYFCGHPTPPTIRFHTNPAPTVGLIT